MTETTISSRRRRIFAFMIDHIIMSFLAGMVCLFAMGKHWDLADTGRMMSSMLPAMLLVFVVYFMKDSVRGMSPGRYVFGIAVRDYAEPNRCPSILRLALRNLLMVIWLIEFFVFLFSKQKRRLGDHLTKTAVIRRKDIPVGKRTLAFFTLLLVFGLLFVGSISAIIKNSSAYEQAIAHVEASSEVKEEVGDIVGYGSFPSGSVQVQNQYGYAQIKIKVNGTEGTIPVVVSMQKEPDTKWELKSLEIKK